MASVKRKCCCGFGCCRDCVRTKCFSVTFGGTFTPSAGNPIDEAPPTTELILFGGGTSSNCVKTLDVWSRGVTDALTIRVEFLTVGSDCVMRVRSTSASGARTQFSSDDILASGIDCETFDLTVSNDLTGAEPTARFTGGTVRVKTVTCTCSGCSASLTGVVAGFTGACGTYLNGSRTMPKTSGLCEWVHSGSPSKARIDRVGSGFIASVIASDGTIGTSTLIPITYSGFPTTGGCPTAGTYTVTFGAGGACSGQTGTIAIS